MQARKFFLDTDTRSFVSSAESSLAPATPVLFQDDVESIELYFLQRNPSGEPAYSYLDYSAFTIKFAVGTTTPAASQITWSAVSTTVTATITTLVNGGSGANEVQKISFSKAPATGGFAIVLPSRNVTVSSVSANVFSATNHGLFNGQSVTITGFSFTGSAVANGGTYFVINRTGSSFSLGTTSTTTTPLTAAVTSGGGTVTLPEITTPSLNYDASPSDVEQSLIDAGLAISNAAQISVSGTTGKDYTLAFGGGCQRINYDAITLAANTLAAAPGMAANLSLATAGISNLIAAATSAVTLEVEVSDGTKKHTYQTSATLSNDLIP
jgi:hypothetical protein